MRHFYQMVSAPDGCIWMNSEQGLWVFEHEEWRLTGDLPYEHLLFWDNNGDIWAAGGLALYEKKGDTWISHPFDLSLSENDHVFLYKGVAIDKQNRFWFENYGNPVIYDNGEWYFYKNQNPQISVLHFDADNTMWFTFNRLLGKFGDVPVFVDNDYSSVPTPFTLDTPYPNPFNMSVTIPFSLPEAARVEVSIYSITGQRVRVLQADRLPAGSHALRWDGRDDSGTVVSSGLYIVRVAGGGKIAMRKVVLVK